ncbi:2-amino-4-hydroxy-6-hydroxymethyldihydropteridine diphosphokinase [Embleya hyalina]|uniref:2-amino-4-hydroxy-6-hydroxymethyldihydropteridine diphosphokinase n=1 Tax=Embleya hyalina TaxID=516124 RepID=A0A401YRM9_9ACTN|nr:2-amino-4-hydroxy-6-hydroxymethyldihydropteridine diphosphokinase [Embleya hyalina]GCD97251.1 2-amino-4-hydroxy-6-hydroxymethyldihydropteridine diphosphokinase [Embleya hyalina]
MTDTSAARTPREPAPEHPAETTAQRARLSWSRVVLALGSNLGNRLETLQGAIDEIADTPGVTLQRVSPVYETDPVGGPEQGTYFNAVVEVRTLLTPDLILERANSIEEAFQRVRVERWGPRTLDVDVIWFEHVTRDDPRLTLPHPRAHERSFVLAPWYDIDPEAELPGHGPIADLLARVGPAGVHRRDDLELTADR